MDIVKTAAWSGALIALCVFIHYEAFRWISDRFALPHVKDRRLVVEVVAIALVAHTLEMVVFAFGYYVADQIFQLGDLVGTHAPVAMDYVYFSMETYTSLGLGDVHPVGAMRLMAGLETLTGLIMIGWSTSFTYLSMRRFWDLEAGEPQPATEASSLRMNTRS